MEEKHRRDYKRSEEKINRNIERINEVNRNEKNKYEVNRYEENRCEENRCEEKINHVNRYEENRYEENRNEENRYEEKINQENRYEENELLKEDRKDEDKEDNNYIEIWEDVVNLKDLTISLSICVCTTFGCFLFAPNEAPWPLFCGLIGAIIGFIISSMIIKPKRELIESSEEVAGEY